MAESWAGDEAELTAELKAHVQERLARYKQPKVYAFVDALPLNPSGKVLKRVLRDRFPGPAPE
jgi:acyl-coenzyme A synthetase/AMP-(fatty) acid ligase